MSPDNTKNLTFPTESAGKLMSTNVPVVNIKNKIQDVQTLIKKKSKTFDSIDYVYIVDDDNKLLGHIPIRRVFSTALSKPIKSFVNENYVFVNYKIDQEHVILKSLHSKYKSIAVVDDEKRFLGSISAEKIIKIADNEAVEDIFKFGGIYHNGEVDDIFKLSIFQSLKHRLPWLLIGLFGGIAAALVIGQYEEVLESHIILAAYLPLLVYMADAVGTQMQSFMVREIAGTNKMKFSKYLFRQASIVLLVSSIVSLVLFGLSYAMYSEVLVSFVLSIALFCASISSLLSGLAVPYIFSKFKVDPANASGPIATIIQDILSVIVYFFVANLILL